MSGFASSLLTIIVLLGVIAIIYIVNYNNLQALRIKINEAESVIDDLLRKKYDLLNTMSEMTVEKSHIPKKTFDNFSNLKDVNISSFDLERKLTEYNNLIEKIKNDHDKLEKDEDFNNSYEDLYEINEKLEAAKSFYNKYTTLLNKAIKKFPSNLIAFFHHIKVQDYFDGKDMFDEEINDFKL